MPVTLRTRPSATTRDIDLSVQGMTCAARAVRVQKKLSKLDGVEAAVNYATGTARVTAPARLPVEALTGAVAAAGYSARPVGDSTAEDADGDAAYLWHRLIGPGRDRRGRRRDRRHRGPDRPPGRPGHPGRR